MGTRLILVVIFFVLPYKEVREDFDNLKSQHIDMYKKPHKKIKAYRAFVYSAQDEVRYLSPSCQTDYFGIKGSLEPIATSPTPCKKLSTCRARAAIDFEVAFANAS